MTCRFECITGNYINLADLDLHDCVRILRLGGGIVSHGGLMVSTQVAR